jgi:putative transcriptional regulator
MKEALFDELMQSATEALEHARGKRDLRTTILPQPPKPMKSREIKRLRGRVHASQAVFASSLNVSTKLVQAWESDRRAPEGSALRLLRLAEDHPGLIFGEMRSRDNDGRAKTGSVGKTSRRQKKL